MRINTRDRLSGPNTYSITKKLISTFTINGKSFFRRDLLFLFAIYVFSKCFEIKYSRNLPGSKYDSTMVTFNLCTDTRQISAAPNSRRHLILLVPFW